MAAMHYNPELHTIHPKWMETVKDLKLYLCSTVHENLALLRKYVFSYYGATLPLDPLGAQAEMTPSQGDMQNS